MRYAIVALSFLFFTLPAFAAQKPPAYFSAESFFNTNYNLRERVVAQVLLIAVGQQNAVPTELFQMKTFDAAGRFQAENGLPASGIVDKETLDRLFAVARPMFRLWDFREIAHPIRGRPIWMPQGMGLRPDFNRNGLTFKDPSDRFQVSYNYFPSLSPERAYESLLDKMRLSGTVVHYSVLKDGWFVISATTAKGVDEYLRYHADGSGVLGFVVFWNNEKGIVSGERIAILMSASLGSVMNGRPFVEPPALSDVPGPQIANAPAVLPLTRSNPDAVAQTPASPNVFAPAPKVEDKISTGSGFFIDDRGRFITNAHVVEGCETIIVRTLDGQIRRAKSSATDAANDLALIQVDNAQGGKFASLRYGARLGEGVAAFGFPQADTLAGGGNFTLGNVTALAGVKDDSRYYQISAPVQRGNSGGPMLDNYGNVVGVVSAKLNALKVAMESGDIPQNVNFAIKGSHLASFLESNGVSITPGSTAGQKLEPADLADLAKSISGFVACR